MFEVRRAAPEARVIAVSEVSWISGGVFSSYHMEYAITGPDLTTLEQKSEAIVAAVRADPRFVDARSSFELGKPELQIQVDRNRAADLGVPVRALADTVRALVGGLDVASFQDEGRRFDVRVRSKRRSATTSRSWRRSRCARRAARGTGRAHEGLGERGAVRLRDGAPRALHGSASQFNSFTQPAVIMLTAPLSFAGAFAALRLSGLELSIFAQIGLVALMGLAMKNGILLVDHANQRREAGLGARGAILEAGLVRLRPVLMTTVATIAGMIPVALARSDCGACSRRLRRRRRSAEHPRTAFGPTRSTSCLERRSRRARPVRARPLGPRHTPCLLDLAFSKSGARLSSLILHLNHANF